MKHFADLDELIEDWTLKGHRPIGRAAKKSEYPDVPPVVTETYKDLLTQLEYFSQKFFSRFVPALYPPHSSDFLTRLWQWLTNKGVSDTQRRLLFEFALRITFISFEDFLQLYRTAFLGPVTRWIIDSKKLKLNDPNFQSCLEQERHRNTWYCPITDSMVISEFYHANGIAGIDQRPAFRSLNRFSNPTALKKYMREKGLLRLVLMEDFVGSGTQTGAIVEWAIKTMKCPILFAPMVICPDGLRVFSALAAKYPQNFVFQPVLALDESVFIESTIAKPDRLFERIAKLAPALQFRIAGIPDSSYGPLGFHQPGDTCRGATIVLFSNTPDNSLPLIHHHSRRPSTWKALFPRVSRETI